MPTGCTAGDVRVCLLLTMLAARGMRRRSGCLRVCLCLCLGLGRAVGAQRGHQRASGEAQALLGGGRAREE